MPSFLNFVAGQLLPLSLPLAPPDVQSRTYVVTGANTGLGYDCAKHLIKFRAKRVILAVRSLSRGEAALTQIRKDTGRLNAGEVWELDLASFASVEEFARRLNTIERLDALIENAGIAKLKYTVAEDLEATLVVNVLSTFLLAFRVLPKLQETAKKFNTKTNLSIVASETGLFPVLKGKFNGLGSGNMFEELNNPKTMDERYPFSKQLDILVARTLASRFPVSKTGVVINVINPGLCRSELSRDVEGFMRVQFAIIKLVLARTTEQGSRTLLHGAFGGPETHGKYLSACAIHDDHLPGWLTGDIGTKKEQRVWRDLLQQLEVKGHGVDLPATGGKG